MRSRTVSRCPAMAIAGLVAGSVLAFLVGGPAQPLFAQDYQVFGDVEGVTTYHYLGDAEAEHRLTGSARIRADHRLTFDRAELVADTEVEIRSPGRWEPKTASQKAAERRRGGARLLHR